jgi:hypothetical protein
MKPNKPLEEIIDTIRQKQEKAYSLRNSQAIDEIEELAIELAAINFSLSYYQVHYEDTYNILEQSYKHECAMTFMEEKGAKRTDGWSDNVAKTKHAQIKQDAIANYTMYQYAKTYHSDVRVLIDTLRGRASTLKKERTP